MIRQARPASQTIALAFGGLTLLFLVAVVPMSAVAHQFTAADVLPVLVAIPFAGVSVLVAYRQPRNPIGWILLLLALVVTVGGVAGFYSLLAYRVEGHALPLSRLAVALAPGWIALIVLFAAADPALPRRAPAGAALALALESLCLRRGHGRLHRRGGS